MYLLQPEMMASVFLSFFIKPIIESLLVQYRRWKIKMFVYLEERGFDQELMTSVVDTQKAEEKTPLAA